MAERKNNVTDEQLAQALRQGKGGRLGGKLLSLVGAVVAIAGIILGGNIVVILIGGVILALGQTVQGKSKGKADRQAFEAIVPGVAGSVLEDVQLEPGQHILRQGDTNIPDPYGQPGRGVCTGDVQGSDGGAVHRPHDGCGRGAAGGDGPVGAERAGGLCRAVDAV